MKQLFTLPFFLLLILSETLSAKEGLRVLRDLDYVGDKNARQMLDVILPSEKSEEPLPVVVFIHGGGWAKGNKDAGHYVLPPLVKRGGFAGVTINYRLTNEAKWPAQLHDCKAAVRWVRANADRYGIDPDRIGVSGLSAGGHLAALIGGTGGEEAFEGKLGEHLDHSSEVSCVVDYFGPTHFVTLEENPKLLGAVNPRSPEARLLAHRDPARQLANAREASPTTHVSAGDPPVLIAHGTRDRLVPYQMSVSYAELLRKSEVPCVLIEMQGGGHGFRSPQLDMRVYKFLQKHLHGQDVFVSEAPIRVGG